MFNTLLAFIILSGSMYLAITILNAIFARSNLLPKPEIIKPQSKTETLVDSVLTSLPPGEFSTINAHAINGCEVETSAVCGEVVTNAEGLAQGLQAVAKSAEEYIGEYISAIIEGFSS